MPKQLDQSATATAEGKQGAAERALLQHLLGQHRQPVHPFAHIGVAASQPDPHTRRQADHPRRAASTRRKARGSTCASTRSVVPVVRMISIRPAGGAGVSGGGAGIRLLSAARRVLAAATSTQAKRPGTGAAAVGCAASKAFRQLYS